MVRRWRRRSGSQKVGDGCRAEQVVGLSDGQGRRKLSIKIVAEANERGAAGRRESLGRLETVH